MRVFCVGGGLGEDFSSDKRFWVIFRKRDKNTQKGPESR
jgi:hypothetical protein